MELTFKLGKVSFSDWLGLIGLGRQLFREKSLANWRLFIYLFVIESFLDRIRALKNLMIYGIRRSRLAIGRIG